MAAECAILIHGLGRRKSSMHPIEDALKLQGFNVVNWDYLSTRQTIEESAQALHECYLLNEKLNARVHFVTHSLGGIVVRSMIKSHDTPKRGRIVMIAPPNQGSAVARMLLDDTPLKWLFGPAGQELMSKGRLDAICAIPRADTLIIAGTKSFDWKNPTSWVSRGRLALPNDGTVSVAETRLPGLDSPLEVYDSHTFITRNPCVVDTVVAYLTGSQTGGAPKKTGAKGPAGSPEWEDAIPSAAKMGGMPNLSMPTLGGRFWWADLVVFKGWRVQRNVLTRTCRLLDPDNVRRAWGSKRDVLKSFHALIEGKE
ncbi:MAG TPA: alpha/beta fold hydrolase [Candidatus Hydrogenedentes bacterium]|nr:alpha/beta fold hydrolase [Candidatus Hydrogenedentota bacterium]